METFKKAEIAEYFNDFLQQNIDSLEDNNFLEDIHHHAFNTDYYIIGTYQAKQWLGDHAFYAIQVIKDYEESGFGEVRTDLSDPERVVNMYAYIVGEVIVWEWFDSLEKSAKIA